MLMIKKKEKKKKEKSVRTGIQQPKMLRNMG
jgi:hypothetical protein